MALPRWLPSVTSAAWVAPQVGNHSTLLRTQVAAEAREAQRLGLAHFGEVQRFPTQSQLESIARAGQAAAATMTASSR